MSKYESKVVSTVKVREFSGRGLHPASTASTASSDCTGSDDSDFDDDFNDFVEVVSQDDDKHNAEDSDWEFGIEKESKEEKYPKKKPVSSTAAIKTKTVRVKKAKKEKAKAKVKKEKTPRARKVVVFSKPTPHLPIPHREYDPVVKLTFGNCIYILKRIRSDKLTEDTIKLTPVGAAERKLHYLGSTILFNHRIRQHLGHIGGGAKITTNNLGNEDDGKYVWMPICILHSTQDAQNESGTVKGESKVIDNDEADNNDEADEDEDDDDNDNEDEDDGDIMEEIVSEEDDGDQLGELKVSEIRQIEYKIKHSALSLGDGTPARFAMRKADGGLVYEKVRKMIILVNLPKWTKKCTRQAVGVPLTISWFMPDEMPSSKYAYLPPYVKEEIIDNYVLPTPPKVIRARKPKARKPRKARKVRKVRKSANTVKSTKGGGKKRKYTRKTKLE